jgi:hypothetical protein
MGHKRFEPMDGTLTLAAGVKAAVHSTESPPLLSIRAEASLVLRVPHPLLSRGGHSNFPCDDQRAEALLRAESSSLRNLQLLSPLATLRLSALEKSLCRDSWENPRSLSLRFSRLRRYARARPLTDRRTATRLSVCCFAGSQGARITAYTSSAGSTFLAGSFL